ncbi:hypothetical protein [Runella sp.]|uniref:hypothetical protein n=1 Tax=Runella sp. TaxID=1960881 RepID=UPI003D1348DF
MKNHTHPHLLWLRRMTYAGVVAIVTAITLNSCAPRTYTIADGTTYQSYTPPAWAPQGAAMAGVQYYYLPDYGMYYDLSSQMYWYNNGGIWASSAYLPSMYAGINLNTAYIVLLQQGLRNPWYNNAYYVRHYPNRCYIDSRGIASPNRVINASSFSTARTFSQGRTRPSYQSSSPRTSSVPQARPSYSAPSRGFSNSGSFGGRQSYSGGGGFRGGGGMRGGRH